MSRSAAPKRIGRYEILGVLGSGGMGEVVRARDSRLGREVALKLLPGEFASDPERLRRFEHEARAASALNHPHIVTIHEIGRDDTVPYIAMELIEGRSLREILRSGPPPLKRTLEIATAVAEGLAAAHAAGIAHRDIKPENVMVGKEGLVKILDFGLARRAFMPGATGADATDSVHTATGTVLGTARYMSPEQAAGRPTDPRTDQFSFGAVLYELVAGRPAFAGETTVDTLSAILHSEPEPLGTPDAGTPLPLRWIVGRCLAKDPAERYASTLDLARDLRALRDHLSEIATGPAGAIRSADRPRRGMRFLAAAAVTVLGVFGGFLAGRRGGPSAPPSFRQLTFRIGEVLSAHFAPDEGTIVYTARWQRSPAEIYLQLLGTPESRSLGIRDTSVMAISRSGEMLLSSKGILARAGLASAAAPREIVEGGAADWSSDGKQIAAIRVVDGQARVEYPLGHVVYRETLGYIGHLRVSRDGERVAFIEHPRVSDMGGQIVVVEKSGASRILTPRFNLAWGLAWSPDGREVWFTASPSGGNQALYAVDLAGRQRVLARSMGSLILSDVSPSGRALVTSRVFTDHLMALAPGAAEERDLTWFDLSLARGISADGRMVLILESGEGGGEGNSIFVRKTDGSPAVRLGEGDPWAFSPDGRYVAALVARAGRASLVLYPVGSGESRSYELPSLEPQWADFLPDGKHVVLLAGEAGRGTRFYLQDLGGGRPRPISAFGYGGFDNTVSPDGAWVVGVRSDRTRVLMPISGGEPVPIPGLTASDVPRGWTADGRFLYVTGREETIPRRIDRVDVKTGRRELWKELGPATGALSLHVARDDRSYAYTYPQSQGDLYLVEGLK